MVLYASASYNILLDRPSINAIEAIVSTPHLAMKFPSYYKTIITFHANQKEARECYMASLKLTLIQEIPKSQAVNMVTMVKLGVHEDLDLDPRTKDD